jgi:Zn-dependent protease
MANRLGDPTPKAQGRLTLSPIHHIDPIGTVLMPLIIQLSAGAGAAPLLAWGRPVQTNPINYTRRFSVNTGHMLVALAGPVMNLIMAAVVSAVVVVGAAMGLMSEEIATGLTRYLVILNLYLMCFNLLPIPPLDGGAVLAWFLPRSMQHVVDLLHRWGFLILLLLLLSPLMGVIMAPAGMLVRAWIEVMFTVAGS